MQNIYQTHSRCQGRWLHVLDVKGSNFDVTYKLIFAGDFKTKNCLLNSLKETQDYHILLHVVLFVNFPKMITDSLHLQRCPYCDFQWPIYKALDAAQKGSRSYQKPLWQSTGSCQSVQTFRANVNGENHFILLFGSFIH